MSNKSNLLESLFSYEEKRDFEGNTVGYDFYFYNKRNSKVYLLGIKTKSIIRKIEGYKISFNIGNIVINDLSEYK
ncbi:MAG: hypothetical protein ACOCRX_09575 [Candidatus Woesearchaeota archaeon]